MKSLKGNVPRMRSFGSLAPLVAAILSSTSIPVGGAGKSDVPCHFKNPSYAGVCTVQPKGRETCKSILAYLNQPNSAGKTYCNDTIIRGGWKKTSRADTKKYPKPSKS